MLLLERDMDTVERSEFAGKRVAVLGAARTGLAAAPVLRDLGATVILSDSAGPDALGRRAEEALALGVEVRLGATPARALEGADLVVPSPGIRPDAAVLRMAFDRGIPILSEIEVAFRIARAPILAVTGTNGKTTTTVLLGEILREAGRTAFVAGNVAADEMKLPLVSAAARAGEGDVIVAEISSFQLMWVERFRPAVGVLTNITQDHLNWHRSFEEYVAAKARLFAAQRPDDVAVVNAVNRHSRDIGRIVRSRRLWFDRGHCLCDDSACVRNGQMTVLWNGHEHILGRADSLRIHGTHNLENALAASAAAIAFGVPADAVRRALAQFQGVVHRMEPVAEIGGILYINNSMCTNVDAAVRSLEAVGRKAVVIAGGSDKNADFAAYGTALSHYARHVVLIGQTADAIEAAAREAGFTAITRADSLEEAVRAARAAALPGDAVMLSPGCASFGMFADFEARGQAFRAAVRALAREEG